MNKQINGIRLFITIVDRHKGKEVTELFHENGNQLLQIIL